MGFIVFFIVLIIISVFFISSVKEQKQKQQKQIESNNQLKIRQEAQVLKQQRIQSNLRLVKKNLIDISNQNNYYEVLSISPSSTREEIVQAFYQKVTYNNINLKDQNTLLCIQAFMVLTDYFLTDYFNLSFNNEFFVEINSRVINEENSQKQIKEKAERNYANRFFYTSNDEYEKSQKRLQKARDQYWTRRHTHIFIGTEPVFQFFDCHLIFDISLRDLHDQHLKITEGYSKNSIPVLLDSIKNKYNLTFDDIKPYVKLKNPIIKMGYLYLAEQKNHITPENTYLCKIGLTTTADPQKRIRNQQTVDLHFQYSAYFESINETEDIIHALYKKLNKHYDKEYFHLSSDDIDWIKTLGSQDTYALSEDRKKEKEVRLQKKQDAYKKHKRYSNYKRY